MNLGCPILAKSMNSLALTAERLQIRSNGSNVTRKRGKSGRISGGFRECMIKTRQPDSCVGSNRLHLIPELWKKSLINKLIREFKVSFRKRRQ